MKFEDTFIEPSFRERGDFRHIESMVTNALNLLLKRVHPFYQKFQQNWMDEGVSVFSYYQTQLDKGLTTTDEIIDEMEKLKKKFEPTIQKYKNGRINFSSELQGPNGEQHFWEWEQTVCGMVKDWFSRPNYHLLPSHLLNDEWIVEHLEFIPSTDKKSIDQWKENLFSIAEMMPSKDLEPLFLNWCIDKLSFHKAEHCAKCGSTNCQKSIDFEKLIAVIKRRIEEIAVEKMPTEQAEKSASKIQLNPSKRGAKTDLLRVLLAMRELYFFTDASGQVVSKEGLMRAFGDFLGEDFSDFHQNVGKAFKVGSLESNIEIFDKMKAEIQKMVVEKRD